MSMIEVNDLSFSYSASSDPIFEHVTFRIDTDWRLGFVGRNGRGKTTFCKLLTGEQSGSGSIVSSVKFDYFPFPVREEGTALAVAKGCIAPYMLWEARMEELLAQNTPEALAQYTALLEEYMAAGGYEIDGLLTLEAGKLGLASELLGRDFITLSHGERTRLLLAALFCRPGHFLLIDEPTNHLDSGGRALVEEYLSRKKGFLLISHDRDLLDGVVDHVLSINKKNTEIIKGNYTVWQEQKNRQDAERRARNERLKKEIGVLSEAARRTAGWSDSLEKTKIGGAPGDNVAPDRGFVGHRAAKMMKRAKNIEHRREQAAQEKEGLLQNIEQAAELKITPERYHSGLLAEARGLAIRFGDGPALFPPLDFTVERGDRVAICGPNGSGKSSILRLLLREEVPHTGALRLAGGVKVSLVPQDTSFLRGGLREYARRQEVDESLFKAILRKMDFSRAQFEKDMAELSAGQKKKVLLARSLCERAHLYVWDEPLNFVDILSRVQVEELLLRGGPTILFVEHDARFVRGIATKIVELCKTSTII